MSLTVHHAPGTAALAEGLAALLAEPVADPFVEEVVVVPTRGVERWLAQRLSHRLGVGGRGADGVCAGVRFLTPGSLVSMLLDRERDDPWAPERLVWPVLETVDASLDEPWCSALAAHLGHGDDGPEAELRRSRRWSVAHRLARLFASYAVQRPGLVADWRAGRDTDGAGGPLDDDLAWQAELWRRVLERVGAPPPDVRQADVVARLAAGDDDLALPGRLSLVGHTRLPASEIALLEALGGRRDVHLWLPVPSGRLWDAVRAAAPGPGPVPRAEDPTSALVRHPLLASLGRDSRELGRALAHLPATAASPSDVVPPAPPSTRLGWLQADLRDDTVPDAATRASRVVAEHDRSIQVHACHGPSRQVDVLREVLVGLLEDDPTLEPRDIVVMCPDIETFAPLVSAGFGLAGAVGDAPGGPGSRTGGPAHPAHRLRVRLADRAPGSTNPLLALAARLLALCGSRVTTVDIGDLLASDVVRRRFSLDDDDLDRVQRWIESAGVRWGLDEEARAPFAMQAFGHNTWRAGLDRILLGVAMSGDDHRHLGRGLPLDDVGSGEVELAGRLAEMVDRLDGTLRALEGAHGVDAWVAALREGVRALGDVPADEAWQWTQLDRELARASQGGDPSAGLRLADVRAMLATRLQGRATRANFRTGTLTVATMLPMRSVPHRVVALLGLDDGVFPRAAVPDGDDVLARRPLTGERDARGEDRQLLLDAVLAATEHLVVTYDGADEHTGARRPPAVPLGELVDAAGRTAAPGTGPRLVTRHPLQPHDARNLKGGPAADDPPEWEADGLEGPEQRPFGFDPAAIAGARALTTDRRPPEPLLSGPLPARPPETEISLDDLRRFLVRPVRTFLRDRLDVALSRATTEKATAIPVTLKQLAKWEVGDFLLREMLAGADVDALLHAELLGGRLGPGQLGEASLREVAQDCQDLWNTTVALREGGARAVDVDIELGGDLAGRRVVGTVTGVHADRVVRLGYSRLKATHRLAGWVDLLALSAQDVEVGWTSHVVGRSGSRPRRALAGGVHDAGLPLLAELVRLRDHGLRTPMPLPAATGEAFAAAAVRRAAGSRIDPAEEAAREWVTDVHNPRGFPKEDAEAEHVRVWGPAAPLRALLEAGLPRAAKAVWEPLLEHEEVRGL
ncbi:exodeoxyribonuclease V subunit gamma [Nocardioides sp. CFH 31398]|uniref:exodeoxyribonuclease V subunit gamma n=1 Tax=Nocardioides sp. CFH 31398 TaxID=2919579 RepID=UPI001F060F75|nr:exodeoxyribonuclease V subunit gamma [Nocardioides sp. CFH 31398]MCH1865421.1 exodeoxyribonuclease V subunit gamma [Nocardioides sp. CFH 31398]